ncbi:hypothetical protein WDU94_010567 [Cyamophila willieti]
MEIIDEFCFSTGTQYHPESNPRPDTVLIDVLQIDNVEPNQIEYLEPDDIDRFGFEPNQVKIDYFEPIVDNLQIENPVTSTSLVSEKDIDIEYLEPTYIEDNRYTFQHQLEDYEGMTSALNIAFSYNSEISGDVLNNFMRNGHNFMPFINPYMLIPDEYIPSDVARNILKYDGRNIEDPKQIVVNLADLNVEQTRNAFEISNGNYKEKTLDDNIHSETHQKTFKIDKKDFLRRKPLRDLQGKNPLDDELGNTDSVSENRPSNAPHSANNEGEDAESEGLLPFLPGKPEQSKPSSGHSSTKAPGNVPSMIPFIGSSNSSSSNAETNSSDSNNTSGGISNIIPGGFSPNSATNMIPGSFNPFENGSNQEQSSNSSSGGILGNRIPGLSGMKDKIPGLSGAGGGDGSQNPTLILGGFSVLVMPLSTSNMASALQGASQLSSMLPGGGVQGMVPGMG